MFICLLVHVHQPRMIFALLEKCSLVRKDSQRRHTSMWGEEITPNRKLSAEIPGDINNYAYVPLFFYTIS